MPHRPPKKKPVSDVLVTKRGKVPKGAQPIPKGIMRRRKLSND